MRSWEENKNLNVVFWNSRTHDHHLGYWKKKKRLKNGMYWSFFNGGKYFFKNHKGKKSRLKDILATTFLNASSWSNVLHIIRKQRKKNDYSILTMKNNQIPQFRKWFLHDLTRQREAEISTLILEQKNIFTQSTYVQRKQFNKRATPSPVRISIYSHH